MSYRTMSPLSEKYFQYRMRQQNQPPDPDADFDRYCPACGYNLRGLHIGRTCPECGSADSDASSSDSSTLSGSSRKRRRVQRDPLLAASEEDRRFWRHGLGLATLAMAVVLITQWFVFLGLAFRGKTVAHLSIVASAASMAVVWIVAVWLATPPSIDRVIKHGMKLRWCIRLTQLLWLPGYALVTVRLVHYAGTNVEGTLHAYSLLLRIVAGIGFLVFVWLMMRIAHLAELEDAARRFNNTIYFLPVPAMIVAAVYGNITWLAAVLLGLVFVAWTWLMMYLVLGFHQMYQHVRWAEKHGIAVAEREQRVHATREELDRQIQSKIRPPSSSPHSDV